MAYVYLTDQELPSMLFAWCGAEGPIDFSSGWTFTVKLVPIGSNASVLTKTASILGRSLMPNVVVEWESGELNLTPNKYKVYLYAKSTVDGSDKVFNPLNPPVITILASPT